MMDLTDNTALSSALEDNDRQRIVGQTSKLDSDLPNDIIDEEIISPLSPIKSRRGAIDLNQGVLDDIENVYNTDLPNYEEVNSVIGCLNQKESNHNNLFGPIKQKKTQGVVGLQNLGNTCYMNSVLQCLFHEPEFFLYFAESTQLLEKMKTSQSDKNTDGHKSFLTLAFEQLFRDYWSLKWSEIEPRDFKSCLGQLCTQFDNYQQQDGQEFLAVLLDTIHEEMNSARKEPNVPSVPEITIPNDIIQESGSPDSAFLSAGSSTDNQSRSPESQLRKRQNSDSSQENPIEDKKNSPSPSSPDSSGSVNLEFNKLIVSQEVNQPAKRPRLTSECTLESENPDLLWQKYIETNDSFISASYQGQFTSELTCNKCCHSSKTYEPFMYLAVPVPNPALVSYQVGFISQVSSQGAQCILYVSVQIEPESKITTLIKSVLEKLKHDDNVNPNAVKLYEYDGLQLTRYLEEEWNVNYIMNQSELVLIEEVNIFEEKTAEIKECSGFKCQICFDEDLEAENIFICNSCGFTICASCEPICASVDENCQNCRRVINGYSKVEKDQKPPAVSPTEQTTCSVSFRDNNDKVIALPTIYNVSAKINSLKIYEAIRMYFYSVCDNPHIEDIDLFYTNMRGDSCSRCQLNHCSGCRVPENYEIELKKYDNFKVVTSTRFDELRQIKSVSYKEYLDTRPTLQTCLDIFSTPEKLEENTVSCQKCNQQTGASKKITVQRWPDTLIIYLKRFVYISDPHPQARKIETEITFELDNLDISRLTTEGSQPPGAYSLVGTIQHFGGIHSGHYISYALDPISKEWTQYNDQSTKAQMPSDQDAKSVYILFYRRQSATSPCEDILPKLDLRSIDEVHAEEADVGCDGFPYDQDLYSKKIRTSPIPNSIIRNNSPNGSPNSLEVDRYSQESLNLDDFDQVQTDNIYRTPVPSNSGSEPDESKSRSSPIG